MYTFKPEKKHAKACGQNIRVSRKDSVHICKKIRKKSVKKAKRFLEDLLAEKVSINGKYYTKAAREILNLVVSAEKNADFHGLDLDNSIVYSSAHQGTIIHRRRRKSGFGSRMKSTNVEVMIVDQTEYPEEAAKKEKKSDDTTKKNADKAETKKEKKSDDTTKKSTKKTKKIVDKTEKKTTVKKSTKKDDTKKAAKE